METHMAPGHPLPLLQLPLNLPLKPRQHRPLLQPKPQHLTQLLPRLDLEQGGDRARLKRDIVRIEDHGGEIPQRGGDARIHQHVGAIPGRPERDRILAQQLEQALELRLELLLVQCERRVRLHRVRDEFPIVLAVRVERSKVLLPCTPVAFQDLRDVPRIELVVLGLGAFTTTVSSA